MLTGVIVSILAVLLLAFFLLYKKEMIIKMFALNISAPANEFTQQLEQTADLVVKRLEDEAAQLEVLLDEAEAKIGMLSRQVEHATKVIEQLIELENKQVAMTERNQVNLPAIEINDRPIALSQFETVQPLDKAGITDKKSVTNESLNIEKHRLIIAMAEQGYNVTEIAKATGMGKGEIMLLLQLHKK
ncbi:DUF6115 domain-containing protein [Sporomusa sp.]|uniref:DUF6115 domain-containing protein n=1 Tax=Sporomusa sp. TaxID=2078658 RepID=UPI002B84891F|nr:hypothetical protein [Sporomusa sp.]HWR43137.1 hypothetical protein [Sporomusa sp.]